MLQYFETLTDDSGNALLGATVTVNNYPSGTPATIFNTNGTASPIGTSTVISDITGQVSFYIPDGAYTLVYSYKSTVYKTKQPVQMIDPMGFAFATDTGTVNAMVVNSSAYPATLYVGLKIEVKAANSNTSTVTFNLNGTGNQPVNLPGGSGLAAGQILTNGLYRLEWDGAEWQFVGSQSPPFYAPSAAEIALNITPAVTFFPPCNILRYGADSTGVASSWSAMNQAVKVGQKTGNIVTVPPGAFLIDTVNGSITLQFVNVEGIAVNNTDTVDNQGSVLNITGTSNSPFIVQAGTSLNGLVFYYPNNITDGVAPIVYPPTLSVSIANGPVNYVYIQECTSVNAYRFFVDTDTTGALGHIFIQNNTLYGILTCTEIAYNSEIVTITGNEYTFGAFNAAQLETNPSFRFTTRTTGSALQINRTDGLTFQGNVIFGYQNGISAPLTAGVAFQQTTISGNYFDQTLFGITVSNAGLLNIVQIADNFMSGYDNVAAQHTLIGNAIKIATSGSGGENVTITGNSFSISSGDSINVSGNTPARSYVIAGNTFQAWGSFQTTGGPYAGVNFTGGNSSMQCTGNSFNGAGSSSGICTGILGSCSTAIICNNEFISSGAGAIGISSVSTFNTNSLILCGNISVGQSGGTFDDVVSATNLYEMGNQWGRPGRFSPFTVPLAAWFQGATDAAAAAASPPVPVGALYYNTTVGAVKVRLS